MIRVVKETDAAHIAKIYNHYILNTLITFEEQPLIPEELLERIKSVTAEYPWLVYEDNGRVVGYAYATRWKERSAYRHTVEVAIYLDVQDIGKHIGSRLTAALLDELRNRKTHSVLAGITLPNTASVKLCEKFGFAMVGQLKEVGYKFDQWVDVGSGANSRRRSGYWPVYRSRWGKTVASSVPVRGYRSIAAATDFLQTSAIQKPN